MNWRQVYDSVCYVVEWGLAHRDVSGVSAIGIDEVQFGKGQQYLTVVYQLCGDARRLLYVGRRREKATLNAFLDEMGQEWCEGIEYVCTDMWKAYLTVVGTRLSNALHILDRFHIVKLLYKWLNRRSQRKAMNWDKFNAMDERIPLPKPRITVNLFARPKTPVQLNLL